MWALVGPGTIGALQMTARATINISLCDLATNFYLMTDLHMNGKLGQDSKLQYSHKLPL